MAPRERRDAGCTRVELDHASYALAEEPVGESPPPTQAGERRKCLTVHDLPTVAKRMQERLSTDCRGV